MPVKKISLTVLLLILLMSIITNSCQNGKVEPSNPIDFPFQRGFNTWVYGDTNEKHITTFVKTVTDLHVNTVTITFPLYMENWTASSVEEKSGITPSQKTLTAMIKALHAKHIAVMLRPIIDEHNLQPEHWRGDIKPQDSK